MAFSEQIRLEVRRKSAFCCCRCHEIGIDVHHIVPQSLGGSDDIENAAPLCQNCHDRFGDSVQKRKEITQMRDWWYTVIEEKYGTSEQYKRDFAQFSNEMRLIINEHRNLRNNFDGKTRKTRKVSSSKKGKRKEPSIPSSKVKKYVTVDDVGDPSAFALTVKGKSMEPRINDGDIIVVSPTATVKSGDTCVVRVGDDDTVKVVKFDNNMIHLIPLNPGYESVTILKSQVSFIWKVVKLISDF
jgi:SOS-response transcriptional repressor LexA